MFKRAGETVPMRQREKERLNVCVVERKSKTRSERESEWLYVCVRERVRKTETSRPQTSRQCSD